MFDMNGNETSPMFNMNGKICLVKDLPPEVSSPKSSIERAGCIFYTFINNGLYICMGKDTQTGDLTDFGGMREKNENIIKCAIRESFEESRGSFTKLTPQNIQNCICIYDNKTAIIFVYIGSALEMIVPRIIRERFETKMMLTEKNSRMRKYNEISDLVWLSEVEIERMLNKTLDRVVYSRVINLIISIEMFYQNGEKFKSVLSNSFSLEKENPVKHKFKYTQKHRFVQKYKKQQYVSQIIVT